MKNLLSRKRWNRLKQLTSGGYLCYSSTLPYPILTRLLTSKYPLKKRSSMLLIVDVIVACGTPLPAFISLIIFTNFGAIGTCGNFIEEERYTIGEIYPSMKSASVVSKTVPRFDSTNRASASLANFGPSGEKADLNSEYSP